LAEANSKFRIPILFTLLQKLLKQNSQVVVHAAFWLNNNDARFQNRHRRLREGRWRWRYLKCNWKFH